MKVKKKKKKISHPNDFPSPRVSPYHKTFPNFVWTFEPLIWVFDILNKIA